MTVQDERRERSPGGTTASLDQQKIVDTHFRSVAPYWKEIYERNDLYALIHQQRRQVALALVERLRLPPGSHILEIGCGAGLTTVELARRGYRVKAVDAVKPMIDLTKQIVAEAGVGQWVKTILGDIRHIAFPDDTFSVALAMGVMPFLDSPDKALREMARVVKPEGHVIVNTDNSRPLDHILDPRLNPVYLALRRMAGNVLWRMGLRKPKPPAPQMVHAFTHSLKEFNSLLSAAGLKKVNGVTVGFGPFSFLKHKLMPDSMSIKIHCKLQSLAERGFPLLRSTGAQYIVLASKQARV